jgi:hypothetical protein
MLFLTLLIKEAFSNPESYSIKLLVFDSPNANVPKEKTFCFHDFDSHYQSSFMYPLASELPGLYPAL